MPAASLNSVTSQESTMMQQNYMPDRMLTDNDAWAREWMQINPAFFAGLSHSQSPKALWIGCSDSRVPAEIITKCAPGELFVHRNIANLVSHADDNSMSVLEYAVKILKVSDIIVCGHYGCSGVKAALLPASTDLPYVARRISPLCTLASVHGLELGKCTTNDEQVNLLAELNVIAQVQQICTTPLIRQSTDPIYVHGWIYGLHDGRIKVLAPGNAHYRYNT